MWMDPARPELEDVSNAFKEVFREFGISTVLADDIQHQDVITAIILDRIRTSEFLIADSRESVQMSITRSDTLTRSVSVQCSTEMPVPDFISIFLFTTCPSIATSPS
jgi:hypothetical protein